MGGLEKKQIRRIVPGLDQANSQQKDTLLKCDIWILLAHLGPFTFLLASALCDPVAVLPLRFGHVQSQGHRHPVVERASIRKPCQGVIQRQFFLLLSIVAGFFCAKG